MAGSGPSTPIGRWTRTVNSAPSLDVMTWSVDATFRCAVDVGHRSIAARDDPSVSVDNGPRIGPAASTSAICGSSSDATSIVATLVSDGRTLPSVADDEDLANRIREVLGADPDVTEQRAFGGLAFLVAGNMAVAASGQGGLLVHVDPAASDALVAQGTARPMEMRDRKMKGWLASPPPTCARRAS